jgi:hypothetical protein
MTEKRERWGCPMAAPPSFYCDLSVELWRAGKTGKNPLNLTKSKRPRIEFKAGLICGEWYCAGLFGH